MCSSTSGAEWKKKKGSTVTTHLHTGERGITWETSSAWALLIQQFYNKIGFVFVIPKYSGHGVDQDDLPLEGVQLTAEPALGPSFSGGVKPQSLLWAKRTLSFHPDMHCTAGSHALVVDTKQWWLLFPCFTEETKPEWTFLSSFLNRLAWNPSNWEAEAGGSRVQGQPPLQIKTLKEQKKCMVAQGRALAKYIWSGFSFNPQQYTRGQGREGRRRKCWKQR